ncbi:hypothetical protein cce_2278 [Crocosphaera subtropica ATCC 51142]|uniref:Uncharacterized protein n=1 Tax=Crocosphaera subtropica (strain ATCC 51142 / BH68) TaxID=43989 RepID=B1WPQ8_CROS5|nr:tetratricopeptide repeat protein [Crocosphaera subtropica]ACB51628.1 hypothetical protein cce_2278 [Crocosphaera subtropica ATCC 51142]
MYLLAKIQVLLLPIIILVTSCFPTSGLSRSLNTILMANSQIITQTYISDPHLNDLLIQGMEKGIKGDYQGAITLFTEVLQSDPNEVEAYYNRGIAYAKINNYQAALDDFSEGLTLNQTMPDLYIERAKVYLQIGNRTAAIADLKQAKTLLKQQGQTSRYPEIDNLLD